MLRLIVRRLVVAVPLLVAVSAGVFSLEAIIPGNAARSILGDSATPQQYEAVRRELYLNRPLLDQYWIYIKGLAHGSLGSSLINGQSVTTILNQRLPVTISLVLLGTVLCAILGISLGVFGAVRHGLLSKLLDGLAVIGLALPTFWVGLILVSLLAVSVSIFPATGYTAISASFGGWLRSLTLPVLALTLGWIASVAKQTRAAMLDVLERDFIRALLSAGISRRRILFKHALRAAMPPVVTILGLFVVTALGGTVFVETVFALPGLGSEAVQAAGQHDLPAIEGVTIYFAIIVLIVNSAVEVAYRLLNPKVGVA